MFFLFIKWRKGLFTTNDEFIEAKTKECPNCKVRILKHGGCNHMTCTRCLYQFCWLCGKKWEGIHKPCPLFGRPNISIENNDNNNSNSNENNNDDDNSNSNENNNDDDNSNPNENNINDNNSNSNENNNDDNSNSNENNDNGNSNSNENANAKKKAKKKASMSDSSDFEDDDTIIDKSFRIPPVNSVFGKKYEIFHKNYKQYLNCVSRQKYENNDNPLREKAYKRSKFIFELDEVDEKFKEILHSYDHALNVLMYSYLHVILMDHETGAFLMFNELLESLQSTYNRFFSILYYCPVNQPYGQIIDLSKRIEKMANDILNAFEL